MNRAERRSLEKKGRLEKGDLKRISNDILIETEDSSLKALILFSVFALRDMKDRFGEKRIGEYIDNLNKKIQEFNEGCFTLSDLEKAMEEEVGFKLKDRVVQLKKALG